MKRLILLLGLLLAAPAWAGDWYPRCNTSDTTVELKTGQWACYQPATKNDDSVALNVAACENFDVFYHLDVNCDATASTTTVQIKSCPNNTVNATACWVLENWTLDGDPATDTEAIYGAASLFIYADFQNDGTVADPQITVICRGPAN